MRVAIISNLSNGIGLETEYRLLRAYLETLGHEVVGLQYDAPAPDDLPQFDLSISLETVSRHLLHVAPVNWLFVNPEWFAQDLIPVVKKHFQKVFAKTIEAQRIIGELFPDKVCYCGFLSRDQYDPEIGRERKFLHVGGNGALRNTTAILDAWRWTKDGEPIGAELTIVSQKLKGMELPPGVTVLERVSEEELKHLQNSYAFHLYPSGTEGYGQSLHEAMSVNATILVTEAPPMSEIASAAAFVPSTGTSSFGLATVHEVSALDVHAAVKGMLRLENLAISWQNPPREEWRQDNELFKESFAEHLSELNKSLVRESMIGNTYGHNIFDNSHRREFIGQRRVAFLGNFAHSFCTESDLAWSFEHLGHEVVRVAEDKGSIQELQAAVLDADMFLWVHTHGWDNVADLEMSGFLGWLRDRRIPSVFYHLDKYWQIPDREERIGVDPCWQCDYVYTADGGFQQEFISRGVNHRWLPPAVVERAVHHGFPRGDLRCDVAFVGAYNSYHREYPFRIKMIDSLKLKYGPRFKLFEGVREGQLNDVYASAKVVVGDSIFAGTPFYWSDRLPETCGRGGFLLFPRIEGMTIPCATYAPQDLDDLIEQIDRWLELPAERRAIVEECMEHVRQNDTYTHRVREVLRVVFGGD